MIALFVEISFREAKRNRQKLNYLSMFRSCLQSQFSIRSFTDVHIFYYSLLLFWQKVPTYPVNGESGLTVETTNSSIFFIDSEWTNIKVEWMSHSPLAVPSRTRPPTKKIDWVRIQIVSWFNIFWLQSHKLFHSYQHSTLPVVSPTHERVHLKDVQAWHAMQFLSSFLCNLQ